MMVRVTQADLKQGRILFPILPIVVMLAIVRFARLIPASIPGFSTMIAFPVGTMGMAVLAMHIGRLVTVFMSVARFAIVLLCAARLVVLVCLPRVIIVLVFVVGVAVIPMRFVAVAVVVRMRLVVLVVVPMLMFLSVMLGMKGSNMFLGILEELIKLRLENSQHLLLRVARNVSSRNSVEDSSDGLEDRADDLILADGGDDTLDRPFLNRTGVVEGQDVELRRIGLGSNFCNYALYGSLELLDQQLPLRGSGALPEPGRPKKLDNAGTKNRENATRNSGIDKLRDFRRSRNRERGRKTGRKLLGDIAGNVGKSIVKPFESILLVFGKGHATGVVGEGVQAHAREEFRKRSKKVRGTSIVVERLDAEDIVPSSI